MSQPIRFNNVILNADEFTGITRNANGSVVVSIGGFESFKFTDPDEAAAVWSYFVNRAPDGMKAPTLTDPTSSAATDARDQEWKKAFVDWQATQAVVMFRPPPNRPAAVAGALAQVVLAGQVIARRLVEHEKAEQEKENASKAAGA